MWDKGITKTIFTLNVDNYAPELRAITSPLIKAYAKKINANIVEITERKFPSYPPVYEKIQIYELAQEIGSDWNIYIDNDTLIHPDCFDFTAHMTKDTVAHNGKDMATHRWQYDRFFQRDGRHIGSCNWFAIASDWCIDLWHPLDDLTLEEATARIFPVLGELNGCTEASHLIDDFTLSRNIAKFGLKHTTLIDVCKKAGYEGGNPFLWHTYNITNEAKVPAMRDVLIQWGVAKASDFVEASHA